MCIAVITLLASVSVATTPKVAVYFDEALTLRSVDHSGKGLHTLCIVAEGFDAQLTSIEYKIEYPAGMTWIKDLDVSPLKIGTTKEGITQAFPKPLDGFSPVVLARAVVRWDAEEGTSGEVAVKPHPTSGFVRATAAPDYRIIEAQGETSYARLTGGSSLRGSEPELYATYPNPFNPVTKITYWLPQKAHVRLTVYDVAGRLVARLVDDERDSGEHTVGWHADDLPSGVYFCRLEVGNFSEQRKVMLLK